MTTVVAVASGPSFTEAQAALIREARAADRCRVIVVNDKYRMLPDADVLYAADLKWWRHWIDDVRATFRGECWTQDGQAAQEYGLCYIRSKGLFGLSRDPAVVHTGSNSGYQAIGLAYHFGATRILLAGYDMQRGPKGETHDFGDHPASLGNGNPKGWIAYFPQLEADLKSEGVELINCSIRTALSVRRGDLATELWRA